MPDFSYFKFMTKENGEKFLAIFLVRPTWVLTRRCKSSIRPAVGSISQRQGCPSRGGI
jgi:hypothetical protein